MSKKHIFLSIYLVIALLFAIFSGDHYHGFFYNLGTSLVWPVRLIPGLGELITAIVWIAVILGVLIFVNKKN